MEKLPEWWKPTQRYLVNTEVQGGFNVATELLCVQSGVQDVAEATNNVCLRWNAVQPEPAKIEHCDFNIALLNLSDVVPEMILIFFIGIVILGLRVGMLHIVSQMVQEKPTSIKSITSKFYELPRILVFYFIIGFLLFFPLIVGGLYNLLIFALMGGIMEVMTIFYVLVILAENQGIIGSMNKFYLLIRQNLFIILQFILIYLVLKNLPIGLLHLAVQPFLIVMSVLLYTKMRPDRK